MFTVEEWAMIKVALEMQAKSARRLGSRADQPQSVSLEYGRVLAANQALQLKVNALAVKK